MQYPPEQPTNQPLYAPSEIYLYDQPQAYAPQPIMPAREITQPVLAQEIAAYANRRQATWRTILCAFCLLVEILFLAFFVVATTQYASPDSDFTLLYISFAIFISLLILAAIAFIGRMVWHWSSTLLFNRKPILIINREGITTSALPSLSGFFIGWNEIEAIYVYAFMYKYLCIRPKNTKLFLKRFNALERFIRLSNSMFGIPPLIVPQIYLDKPVEEILQSLYHRYSNELSYHRIQLRP